MSRSIYALQVGRGRIEMSSINSRYTEGLSLTWHRNLLKAYFETLLNFNRDDGETGMRPPGWVNAIDLPDTLMDQAHDDFAAMRQNH